MKHLSHRVIVTPGEPAGIGPELVVQLAQRDWPVELVVCADPYLLISCATQLKLPLTLDTYVANKPPKPQLAGRLTILPILLKRVVKPGELTVENSSYVLQTLATACDKCLHNEFSALITGPIHKEILSQAGYHFTGHTEYLAQLTASHCVVMAFVLGKLRLALVTTHLPLSQVPKAITVDSLYSTIAVLNNGLKKNFSIKKPNIYVCGLNPHAGEGGYLGTEEIEVIQPALQKLRSEGLLLTGPLPADTLFQPGCLQQADAILSMYHDQGLAILKYMGWDRAAGVTFGLPFIRTSVAHGTALNLAGTGKANVGSLLAAVQLAISLTDRHSHG